LSLNGHNSKTVPHVHTKFIIKLTYHDFQVT